MSDDITNTPINLGEMCLYICGIASKLEAECNILLENSSLKKLKIQTKKQLFTIMALRTLEKNSNKEITLKTIANHVNMTSSAASVLIKQLVGAGICRRLDAKTDRRAKNISLTTKGQHCAEIIDCLISESMCNITKKLSITEKKNLLEILESAYTKNATENK